MSVNSSGACLGAADDLDNIQISGRETPADEISSSLALLYPAPRSSQDFGAQCQVEDEIPTRSEVAPIDEAVGKATHQTETRSIWPSMQRVCVAASAARASASFSGRTGRKGTVWQIGNAHRCTASLAMIVACPRHGAWGNEAKGN